MKSAYLISEFVIFVDEIYGIAVIELLDILFNSFPLIKYIKHIGSADLDLLDFFDLLRNPVGLSLFGLSIVDGV